MTDFLNCINRIVWGIPLLSLIIGVGIYIGFRTGFPQAIRFKQAVFAFGKQFKAKKKAENGVSPYQALCTALAATVGTGNLAGVAGAIAIGGPGAIFWMWVCGFLGMGIKFAEATLSVQYRKKNANGEYLGGPMYMIRHGLSKNWHWMAAVYCFFGVVASLGVGNATQINTVIGGIKSVVSTFGGDLSKRTTIVIGIALAVLIGTLLLGGAKRIGAVTQKLVPAMALGYLILGVVVLIMRADAIPSALYSMIQGAFSPQAVTGGMVGSVFSTLRIGASRGVFTNEAGMGTAAIAHAAGNVIHPVEQGLMGIMEVFIDTIVICTMTALVILSSEIPIPYGTDVGVSLTTAAFSAVLGEWVCIPLAFSLCCFAIATILGWGLYGARCAQYLFGEKVWKNFVLVQVMIVAISAVLKTSTVWTLSDIVNGLMAIPNLITLALLTGKLKKLNASFKNKSPNKEIQALKN